MLSTIRDLRSVYERLRRIRAKMQHNFVASPADWSALETLWGVPTGKGDDVFTLIDGAAGSMEGTFQVAACKDLTEQVG